jgi:flagellar assembly protein FliH
MPSFDMSEQSGSRRAEFVAVPFEGLEESVDFKESGLPGQSTESSGSSEAAVAEPVPLSPEEIRQQGYDAGHREGAEAARAELPWRETEALVSAASAFEEAARRITSIRRSYLNSHRHIVVELAMQIAERLIGREVAADPDALASIVERSLELFEALEAPIVLLAPADREILDAGGAPELQRLAGECELQFETDASLDPGDVRVRNGNVQVDGRVSELLRRLREELAQTLDVEEEAAE